MDLLSSECVRVCVCVCVCRCVCVCVCVCAPTDGAYSGCVRRCVLCRWNLLECWEENPTGGDGTTGRLSVKPSHSLSCFLTPSPVSLLPLLFPSSLSCFLPPSPVSYSSCAIPPPASSLTTCLLPTSFPFPPLLSLSLFPAFPVAVITSPLILPSFPLSSSIPRPLVLFPLPPHFLSPDFFRPACNESEMFNRPATTTPSMDEMTSWIPASLLDHTWEL